MVTHLLAYVLYLASLIFYFIETFTNDKIQHPKFFEINTCVKMGMNSLSLIMLSYVFWTIHKTSL